MAESQGAKVVSGRADVRSFAEISTLVGEALDVFDGIDVVVANADVISYERSWALTEQQFDTVIDINLKGVWNRLRAVIPSMIDRGEGGSLIITSSTAGLRGQSVHGPLLGQEARCRRHGEIHGERAGSVRHPRQHHPLDRRRDEHGRLRKGLQLLESEPDLFVPVAKNMLPDAFILQPEDISDALLWLASDEAKYVTRDPTARRRGQHEQALNREDPSCPRAEAGTTAGRCAGSSGMPWRLTAGSSISGGRLLGRFGRCVVGVLTTTGRRSGEVGPGRPTGVSIGGFL